MKSVRLIAFRSTIVFYSHWNVSLHILIRTYTLQDVFGDGEVSCLGGKMKWSVVSFVRRILQSVLQTVKARSVHLKILTLLLFHLFLHPERLIGSFFMTK